MTNLITGTDFGTHTELHLKTYTSTDLPTSVIDYEYQAVESTTTVTTTASVRGFKLRLN